MSMFYDKLKHLYSDFKAKIEKTVNDLKEQMKVKPKYIELPGKYYDALKKEELLPSTSSTIGEIASAINDLSVKIKAETLVEYSTIADRELNKLYADLKVIEGKMFKFIDEAFEKTIKTMDSLREADLKLDSSLKKIFGEWIEVEKYRRNYLENLDSFIEELVEDYGKEMKNIEYFESRIGELMKNLDEQIDKVKSDTRDHRKILLKYLCFAEGVRTKGVKLYLPVYRIVVLDGRGRRHEIQKIYSGNLKVNDRMIETIRKLLDGIDEDFVDSMKKYIRTNYSGLKKFYLLRVLKTRGRG